MPPSPPDYHHHTPPIDPHLPKHSPSNTVSKSQGLLTMQKTKQKPTAKAKEPSIYHSNSRFLYFLFTSLENCLYLFTSHVRWSAGRRCCARAHEEGVARGRRKRVLRAGVCVGVCSVVTSSGIAWYVGDRQGSAFIIFRFMHTVIK